MLRLLPLIGSLVLAPVPVRAGEFTGFYAGVNAGYCWDREETRESGPAAPAYGSGADGSTDNSLPPSASAAAAALRRSDPRRAPTGR